MAEMPGFLLTIDLSVTGIEISETAIELAKKHFEESIKIHHGSVGSMPFDQELYDGIFCYALIHFAATETINEGFASPRSLLCERAASAGKQ